MPYLSSNLLFPYLHLKAALHPSRMVLLSSDLTQVLLAACADGDLDRLRNLLDDRVMSNAALRNVNIIWAGKPRPIVNLRNLVEKTARCGHADLVAYLFAFGRENSIDADALVSRETVTAALMTSHVDVLAEFIRAQPSCVNLSLGYAGDPLSQAISGPYRAFANDTGPDTRVSLVRYLLEHGADPNHHCCGFSKPGYHLYTAVNRGKPTEMIRLLLEHGARVDRTGATVAAAELGRIDVLELFLEYGADVNQPLTKGIVRYHDREKTAQLARETPIEAALRKGQQAAVQWLIRHGAE